MHWLTVPFTHWLKIFQIKQIILKSILIVCFFHLASSSWEEWWTYDGISGPAFWGRLNPKWNLCSKGRKQSPIDIKPEVLLYDPMLPPLELRNRKTSGQLINTGRGLLFRLQSELIVEEAQLPSRTGSVLSSLADSPLTSNSGGTTGGEVQFLGGPLTYVYTLSRAHLHYGRDERRGSEHSIAGQQLPGELQLMGYNSQLYGSLHEAQSRAHGMVAISALIQLEDSGRHPQNRQLLRLVHALKNITSKGSSVRLDDLDIGELLSTDHLSSYLTYEGSLTQPACYETVSWLVLNKPLYLDRTLFAQLRLALHLGEHSRSADNFRPVQKLNNRSIRTNIQFAKPPSTSSLVNFTGSWSESSNSIGQSMPSCKMRSPVLYRANSKYFGADNL